MTRKKKNKNNSRTIIILILLVTLLAILLILNIFTSKVDLYAARFNINDNELKITLLNKANKDAYFKGVYTIISPGDKKQIVGDIEPILIKPNELKTVVYDMELTELYNYKLKAKITSGSSPDSLKKYKWEKVDIVTES